MYTLYTYSKVTFNDIVSHQVRINIRYEIYSVKQNKNRMFHIKTLNNLAKFSYTTQSLDIFLTDNNITLTANLANILTPHDTCMSDCV